MRTGSLVLAALLALVGCSSDAAEDSPPGAAGSGGAAGTGTAGGSGTGGASGGRAGSSAAGQGGSSAGQGGAAGAAGEAPGGAAGSGGTGGSAAGAGGSPGGAGGSAPMVCAPGQQIACACPGSSVSGAQACNDQGNGYGPCQGCPGGAGGGSGAAGGGEGGSGPAGAGGAGGEAPVCPAQAGPLEGCPSCQSLTFPAFAQGEQVALGVGGLVMTMCPEVPCTLTIEPGALTLARDAACSGSLAGSIGVRTLNIVGKVALDSKGSTAAVNYTVGSDVKNASLEVSLSLDGSGLGAESAAVGLGCSPLGAASLDCALFAVDDVHRSGPCDTPGPCDVWPEVLADQTVFHRLAESVRQQLAAMAESGACTPGAGLTAAGKACE